MEVTNRIADISAPCDRVCGHALTELLVSMVFFVPVFVTVPLLGKYLDLKQTTIEAGRYAVWERTVWSDAAASWNDGENGKSDTRLRKEVTRRLYGHPLDGIDSSGANVNPLWRDYKGRKLLAGTSAAVDERAVPAATLLVDQFAFKGLPGIRHLADVNQVVTNTLGRLVRSCRGAPGVDLQHGLNLGARNYAVADVTANVKNYTVTGGELPMHARGGILSNAWAAPGDEGSLRRRIGRLVPDELVACVAAPGAKTFGMLSRGPYSFIFGEGRHADRVDVVAKSTVLLPEYRK